MGAGADGPDRDGAEGVAAPRRQAPAGRDLASEEDEGLGRAVGAPVVDQQVRDDDSIRIPFDFALNLRDDLPSGLYVPVFSGYTLAEDGSRMAWAQADTLPARLPLILNVGGVEKTRLLWTLFADDPSNGSRGVLPAEDAAYAALSNRVRFNSPTYILPPFAPGTRDPLTYPFEPYLLNQLPNSNDQFGAPLSPFQFPVEQGPAGELNVRITRPDGTVSDLGSTPIVQNQLASSPADERLRFGRQSPLNEYRLATLNPPFTARSFDQYGEYTIELSGTLEDTWGNAYEGGGTYTILSAELLDLTPGVMTGTPFVVGDALNFGLHVAPGFPAELTVTLLVYPLDGSNPIEQTVSGSANAHGYFQPDDAPFVFETPGEYVIEYEARYTDSAGRLWAASTRGAGVIAEANAPLIAHGERGLPGVRNDLRPAWFSLPEYASITRISAADATLSLPYHSGDVIRLPDGEANLLQPAIRVQDLSGAYANWLLNRLPENGEGMTLRQLASEGEMPVLMLNESESTSYFTATRPNVTVRQFVSGGDDGGLTLGWDNDDPLNQQPGAGVDGSRPNDFIFLFGGAVIDVPSGDADPIRSSAVYAALAVIGEDTPPRVFPPDRGAAGGADGGPLLMVNGQAYDAFINLTGVQPGDVLVVGDTVTVAGQVAPTIAAQVSTTYTAPSGEIQTFTGRANAIGMYYDPAAQFAVDQTGLWTVEVRVVLDGLTSAGQIEPPYPQGSILGTPDGRFTFTVLPRASEPLPWNSLLKNTIIPTVSPYNFSFTLPEDWTEIEAYYTLTTPGYVIEDDALRMNGRTFSYSYNAPQQSRTFPNLENDSSGGAFRSDVRTLTFTATGIDSSGTRQIRSRTFTLMHDHLITTE